MDFNEKENVISNIIKLCNIIENKHNIPYDRLISFIEINEFEIKKEFTKQILDLFFFDESERYGFGRAINIYVEKCSRFEVEEFIKNVLNIDDLEKIEIDFENKYFKKLLYSFTFLSNDIKESLKEKIVDSLRNNYNEKLYNLVSIYNLIDYDNDLFMKFVSSIPDMSNTDKSDFFYGDNENTQLGYAINLIFKYDLEINEDLKKLSKSSHIEYYDYYCWLLDIEDFDYSKFNPYWILKYQTIYYFNRFKKSQKLKDELSKCLRKNHIEGVAKIYFEHLI